MYQQPNNWGQLPQTPGQFTPPPQPFMGYAQPQHVPPMQPSYEPQRPQYQPAQYQPPLSPKKPRRWPWIVAIIVALLVGYAAGAGSHSGSTATNANSYQQSNTAAATQAPAQQQQSSGTQSHKVHEAVTADGTWQVTLTKVSMKSAGDSVLAQPVKAGNQYLLIDVLLKNISQEGHTASSIAQWDMRDTDGNQYNSDVTSFQSTHAPEGSAAPGQQIRGTLVYEVPKSQRTYTLNFRALLTSNPVTFEITD